MQHLTGHQIATLAQNLRSFYKTGAFCTLVKLQFLVIFALQRQSQGLKKRLEIQELGLDIETGIETFDS